jgi:DNA invertase Pin-like site-specific DNA recombinase
MPVSPPQRRPGQDQNLALQIDAFKKVGCEKNYQEKISGASTDRPELTKLLEIIRDGDTLVIWKLDRLGRSLIHLVQLITDLEQRQVGLLSLN